MAIPMPPLHATGKSHLIRNVDDDDRVCATALVDTRGQIGRLTNQRTRQTLTIAHDRGTSATDRDCSFKRR